MSNRIFDKNPETLQELEILVYQAFDEMGYDSHRKHPTKTARGTVEIDVFAKKETTPIPSMVLCECIVVLEYPRKILGFFLITSRSRNGRRRTDSSPPIVDIIALIDGSENACIKSSALALGFL